MYGKNIEESVKYKRCKNQNYNISKETKCGNSELNDLDTVQSLAIWKQIEERIKRQASRDLRGLHDPPNDLI